MQPHDERGRTADQVIDHHFRHQRYVNMAPLERVEKQAQAFPSHREKGQAFRDQEHLALQEHGKEDEDEVAGAQAAEKDLQLEVNLLGEWVSVRLRMLVLVMLMAWMRRKRRKACLPMAR
jgi:hypothetical protein